MIFTNGKSWLEKCALRAGEDAQDRLTAVSGQVTAIAQQLSVLQQENDALRARVVELEAALADGGEGGGE